MAVQRSIFIYQQNSVSKQKCFFQNMFDNQSSLSPWPLGTRQQCSWCSDCRDSAKRSECLQQARDKVKKKLQSDPDLKNWGHGDNDTLFKGWWCNENYKPKTSRPQTLRSSSLLRRLNKVRSKTSENKRQKIQFKEYSENNMYILKPRNCQTYFRDSDLSFIVQKYFKSQNPKLRYIIVV